MTRYAQLTINGKLLMLNAAQIESIEAHSGVFHLRMTSGAEHRVTWSEGTADLFDHLYGEKAWTVAD